MAALAWGDLSPAQVDLFYQHLDGHEEVEEPVGQLPLPTEHLSMGKGPWT